MKENIRSRQKLELVILLLVAAVTCMIWVRCTIAAMRYDSRVSTSTTTEIVEDVKLTPVKITIRDEPIIVDIHQEDSPNVAVAPDEIKVQPKTKSRIRYYDVPLSNQIQRKCFQLCKKYDVDPKLAFALMKHESCFEPQVISQWNDYGLMQINQMNHNWLSSELGITDFLDPEQNMKAGLYILGSYLKKYDNVHLALMAYNMGENRMNSLVASGVYSSNYSRTIVGYMDEISYRKETDNISIAKN